MLSLGAAFCISNHEELEFQIEALLSSPQLLNGASSSAIDYVNQNRGASKEIVDYLFS
jgi:hypothetical protein